jgi:ABC-type transport system involved in cytochrome bd biosynthesis fused ATPase/permease subunit
MDKIRTIFGREPVVWQTALMALVNLLVVFGVINWTAAQIGAVNAALAAILGLIVRSVVTPLADPRKNVDGTLVPLVPDPTVIAAM